MGSRVRIKHVDSGVRAVLKSDGVKAMLESQAAAAAGGLAGKEDRVPTAEAEDSVATKAPMPTAARVNENAMMARRAVGSARHTIPAAEMFRNSGRRATCTPSL